jgi:signal transduction histidine kinase
MALTNTLVAARYTPELMLGEDGWYESAMERLVDVVQDLSKARTVEDVTAIVREAARHLTGADGATFVLKDGDFCFYLDEDAVAPLWKGQRFPLKICISGMAMADRAAIVIDDIFQDPRVPIAAYEPTFVKSMAMVPIRKDDPIGAIGLYWATKRHPSTEELKVVQALANITSVTMENVSLYNVLQTKVDALETTNAELRRFAWVASHDLKSPLRAIDNLSQWIAEDLGAKLDAAQSEQFSLLRKRVRRMEKLLDDMLSYAQSENTSESRPDIVTGYDLVEEVVDMLDVPKTFTVEIEPVLRGIKIPHFPLQRVFSNLIDNAVKHHDRANGRITVRGEVLPLYYRFEICDDGPGIAPQFHQRVFEMFETLQSRDSKEGSGMGLAFVKKIVSSAGGTVTLTSDPGKGCVFSFTWPQNTPNP